MDKKVLEIVSMQQRRDYEVLATGEDSMVAIGDMKSTLAVRVEGSDRIFLVRVSNELFAELGGEAAPDPEKTVSDYPDGLDGLTESVLKHVRGTGNKVMSCDDPMSRTVGFASESGELFKLSLTSMKETKHPLLIRHAGTALGRRKMAECLSHGHGPSEWDDCTHCSAVLSGSSDVG